MTLYLEYNIIIVMWSMIDNKIVQFLILDITTHIYFSLYYIDIDCTCTCLCMYVYMFL